MKPALFPSPSGVGIITKTELEILKRVYLPDKIIADDLNISPHTVNTHMTSIRIKTGYKSKPELSVYATKQGLIN